VAIGIGRREAGRTIEPEIRVLRPDDIPSLRLGWQHRHEASDIEQLLGIYPGRSVWLPDTREFVLLGPWRHRPEIAGVMEVAAVRNAEALIGQAVRLADERGATLVLMTEMDERRRPAFYERMGFVELEEVITYETGRVVPMPTNTYPLSFVQVAGHDTLLLEAVLRLDHRSFPWLWWNSSEELAAYSFMPGVAIFAGMLGGEVITYAGVTTYPGWGHLDRIAVHPDYQGQGLGRTTLAFALGTLGVHGARRIGLSTQGDNARSQRMYEHVGFKRSRSNDYRLYGHWLRDPESAS
jgi:ribosomal protein S18 acetylase RimI-like enzyme